MENFNQSDPINYSCCEKDLTENYERGTQLVVHALPPMQNHSRILLTRVREILHFKLLLSP